MNTAAIRTLVIYAIVVPLAVMMGWMAVDLANWDRTSFTFFASVVFVLLLPALLRWHYAVMLWSWNTAITVFFVPGQPALWMLMAAITFAIAVVKRIIEKRRVFVSAPSITGSLLALLLVVVVTAVLRGGFGSRTLGSSLYGGKGYYYIFAAILGYFALVSLPVRPDRAKLYVALFFLGGLVPGISNLIYFAGPSFYFLFLIFPAGFAGFQAITEYSGSIVRIAGTWATASAVTNYLMAIHGIRGILQKWWLALFFIATLALGTLAGFRSMVLLFGAIFVVLFVAEGLLRSPIFPALLLMGALAFAALVPFASHLPLSVQRTLSILPLDINRGVRNDADASWNWRVLMWEAMIPDLPKYVVLGKGYALNPTDLYLAQQAARRFPTAPYETALAAGDYHSGPLSVYVPFGSFGCAAFLAFLFLSCQALHRNYLYGAPELRTINRFLFAYFCGRAFFFFAVFGALSSDLYHFVGAVGLSVAFNHGVCRKPATVAQPMRLRGNVQFGGTQPRPA